MSNLKLRYTELFFDLFSVNVIYQCHAPMLCTNVIDLFYVVAKAYMFPNPLYVNVIPLKTSKVVARALILLQRNSSFP